METSAGSVVYTGDFRFHGYKGDLTRAFMERAAQSDLVALICEGTRTSDTLTDSEQTVKDVAKKRVEKTDNLGFVNFAVRDTDRMQSFFQVAKETTELLLPT